MPTIDDVKAHLAARGVEVWEFEAPTPTAETAAAAVGCSVGEIAKTILFLVGDRPVVVVAAGDAKVKGSKLKRALGWTGKVRLPGPEDVVRHTGYSPGGVCPFLLPEELPVLVDRSLRRFSRVYPAAGNDHSAVPLTVDRLLDLTDGREVDVCDLPGGEGRPDA
ncbi:MAG: YbaK/EbsC family protein [Candidatus Dadabacteria bacterium]|nr:MAG: YbaK/EbsC family protein [Candidatus Dadabacteria bacterium]